jgi:hypothetical protein
LCTMAHGKKVLLVVAAGLVMWQQRAFVPPPAHRAMPAASAAAVTAALSAPAFADNIDSAAKKLAAASYPFLKEIDWNSQIYASIPGANNQAMLKAVDKALVMGAAMDGKLLQDAVMAHHKAVGSAGGKGVTSQGDYEQILAKLGKAIASVPEATVLDTFNAYKGLINTPGQFPAALEYLKSKVNPADAYAAGGAFLEFADVVKKAR